MKDKLYKRRDYVQWKILLSELEDTELNGYYYLMKTCHPKMSDNRLAYLTLLHFYDKKVLDYYRITKDIHVFDVYIQGINRFGYEL